jgi:hypothetical protein
VTTQESDLSLSAINNQTLSSREREGFKFEFFFVDKIKEIEKNLTKTVQFWN